MTADRPLDGVTVVELVSDYDAYAGKLLAGLGAEVVTVEPPGGSPARETPPTRESTDGTDGASAFFGFLNTTKRSVVLDGDDPDDRDRFSTLLGRADVLVADHLDAFGLSQADVRSAHPDLVVVTLTPFGYEGSRAGQPGTELTAEAAGGLLYQTGSPERPPTRPGLSVAAYFGPLYAAIGALIALRVRDRVGGQHVDLSSQEMVAAHLESSTMEYSFNDRLPERLGNRHAVHHPFGAIYPVADGYVCLAIAGSIEEGPLGGPDMSMWAPFCELIGREDLHDDERFTATPDDELPGHVKRLHNADELDPILREALADWEKEDLYHEAQERGIAVGVVATAEDCLEDDQLRARDFFADVTLPDGDDVTMPTLPYEFETFEPANEPPPAPGADQDLVEDGLASETTAADADSTPADATDAADTADDDAADTDAGVLDGVTVLDFTMVWAGPYCSRILADHGAEVIKVESTHRPDITRTLPPLYEDAQSDPAAGEDRSGYFLTENRNKRSLTLNLKTDDGTAIVEDLVESGAVDVVVESISPGVMAAFGLGPDHLRDLDEDLVVCSLSGYGQHGPESGYRAYGPVLEAQAGIAEVTGFPGDQPLTTSISFTDPSAALHGAVAILAALRSEGGEYVDLSQLEAGAVLTHQAITTQDRTGETTTRRGNRDERDRFVQGVYPCDDDSVPEDEEAWVALAIRDEDDWAAVRDAMGDLDWADDERFASQDRRLANQDALDDNLADWTGDQGRDAVVETLRDAGVPASPVATAADLLERDDHLAARDFWTTIDHPTVGEHPYPGPLPPLSETPGSVRRAAPRLGADTEAVLREYLDLDDEAIRDLDEAGAID